MLFDLSSPGRKNVIRVVYGVLAFLFLIGFVGFGIGGEFGSGGIIDSLTGGGGGGSTAEQFEEQIDDAEKQLESDPQNPKALEELITLRFQSGQVQLDVDEAGIPSLTEEARGEFEASVDAWNQYVDAEPKKIDITAASSAVNAYRFLEDAEGAAQAQQLLAEADPSTATFSQLAFFRYAAGDLKSGDEAVDQAVAEAKADERKQVERQLAQIRKQAVKLKEQLKKLPEGAEGGGLENPFGGFSPEGGTVPPTAP
jgi:hypothetical protein